MKTCPQCNLAYQDDYLFCLTDGNTLRDESGEQETIFANRVVFSEMSQTESAELKVTCTNCGLANRANSKFCKKCGALLAGNPQLVLDQTPTRQAMPPQGAEQETMFFQPQRFAPPNPMPGTDRQRSGTSQNAIIGGILVLVVAIGGIIIYNLQAGEPASNKPASKAANAVNTAANTVQAHPDIGRKGRLLTNQRIRSAPNLDGEIRGVHYRGALIKVLEVTSYSTVDGYMTWYRVQVLENGCDAEGIRGCGNDLYDSPGMAAMEGWTSAKNVGLD